MLANAAKLVRCTIGVNGSPPLADAEEHAHFPRGLAGRGPTEHLEFARYRRRIASTRLFWSHDRTRFANLSVWGEKYEVRDHPPLFHRNLREGAIAIDAKEEMPTSWQVHRHRDSVSIEPQAA